MAKSILDNFTPEEVQNMIDNSESYSKVLEKLGYKKKSGNFQIVQNYIRLHSLSIDKMEENRKNVKHKPNKHTIPLEEILVENSTYTNRTSLKKRLLRAKMLEYVCFGCGNKGNHRNKPLTLQLEHKNGVNNDNRLENLGFLCPNCHSQTETFAGKKLKKPEKRICPQCGGVKHESSIVCKHCALKNYKTETINKYNLSRETLKEQIRKLSFSEVAKLYEVTPSSVRRWCKIFELPSTKEEIENYTDEEWKLL